MTSSESVNEIATALSKSQQSMTNPGFDKVNPHFKSKYASLAAVRDSIVTSLSKNGIAVLQETYVIDGGVMCRTKLIHTSGQWIECEPYRVPVEKSSAQGVASATTYARRLSLQSFLVVAGDDDDDGNIAEQQPARQHRPEPKPEPFAGNEPLTKQYASWVSGAKDRETYDAACKKITEDRGKFTKGQLVTLREACQEWLNSQAAPPVDLVQTEPGELEPDTDTIPY